MPYATASSTSSHGRTSGVRRCAAQSHRSLPRTSPVKHTPWMRTSGGTSRSADTTAAGQAEGELFPAVDEPVERVRPRGRAESVSEPQQQHDLNTDLAASRYIVSAI